MKLRANADPDVVQMYSVSTKLIRAAGSDERRRAESNTAGEHFGGYNAIHCL